MIKKRHIRGRQALAVVVTVDSTLLFASFLLLLTAIDLGNKYDFAFLLVHMLHLFTLMLGYVVVRHSASNTDSLRILLLVYVVLLITDTAILMARFVMLSQWEHEEQHLHLTLASRIILVTCFVVVDAAGVLFAMWAQDSAFAIDYSNEQLMAVASRAAQHSDTVNTGVRR